MAITGKVLPGRDVVETKRLAARIFKTSPEGVEKLFSGKPRLIKKGLDGPAAKKILAMLQNAGIEARIIADRQAGDKAAPKTTAPPAPVEETAEEKLRKKVESRFEEYDQAYERAMEKGGVRKRTTAWAALMITCLGGIACAWILHYVKWQMAVPVILAATIIPAYAIVSGSKKALQKIIEPLIENDEDSALAAAGIMEWIFQLDEDKSIDLYPVLEQAVEKRPEILNKVAEYSTMLQFRLEEDAPTKEHQAGEGDAPENQSTPGE